MDSLKKAFIWFFLFLLLGLPISFLAFGSELTSQKSALYPFHNVIELQDDFLTGGVSSGTLGSLGWFMAGGTNTGVAGEAGAPGIFRKETSAVINTFGALLLSGTQTAIDAASLHDSLWRARLNTNDANTAVRIGYSNTCTVNPTNGYYFEKAAADTNWFAVTNNGGVTTRTDTGIAVDTNFHYFYVVKQSASVLYSIDSGAFTTITTNIPATDEQPCAQITNTAAANKTIDFDYFQLRIYVSR